MKEYGKVCLRRGEEKDVRGGSFWIFDNEIDWYDDICPDGGIVDVIDSRMKFVARGYFNSKSRIVVRVLTRDKNEDIDEGFFRRKIQAAWDFRKSLGFSNSCRVIFGESDGLPGLTVDKFGDYLSFQIVSLGMEHWKSTILQILVDVFAPKGIYERGDVPVREKEGLPQITGCVYGQVPDQVDMIEHDANMLVDIPNGQKTGHFLDQQEN
ncbi:MAG: class I SAM-dependent rRNA methyltransferase, partial [Clostridia bacterium]|nr:class I SAM-dependent rRNA methyltransferase [Clostridia bacterium]